MASRFGDEPYVPIEGFDTLRRNRPLALSRFETRPRDSFQRKTYLYNVQVVTRDRRTGEEIFRQINVTEKDRSNLDDVLNSARDVIMDSPVSAREEFDRVELIGAFRNPYATNVD